MSRYAAILLALLVAAVLTGCSRDPAPDYDRDGMLILREMLDAIEAGDHELSAKKAERLSDREANSHELVWLSRHYAENDVIVAINARLADDDLPGALETCHEALVRQETPRRLRRVENWLEALLRVQAYVASKPFPNSDAAREAIAALPTAADIGGESAAYSQWLGDQEAMMEALAAMERERLQVELLAELEIAVLTADTRAEIIAAQLAATAPDDPRYSRWGQRIAGDLTVPEVLALPEGRERDLGIVLLHRRSRTAALSLLRRQPATPASFAGQWLVALQHAEAGDLLGAADGLRALETRLPGLDLRPALAPFDADLAAEPAHTLPTVANALRLLYRIQATPSAD